MKNTYTARVLTDEISWAVEQPFSAVAGHPYLEDQCGGFVLYNKPNSGRIVRLHEAYLSNLQQLPNASTNTIALNRTIQALETTTGSLGEVVTMTKLDSNNANLPTGVNLYKRSQLIVTGATTIMRPNTNKQWNLTTAGALLCARHMRLGSIYSWMDATTSEKQRHVIRAGEGMLFQVTVAEEKLYTIGITIRIGTSCYTADVCLYGSGFQNGTNTHIIPLYLRNDTGSGQVVEVLDVWLTDFSIDTLLVNPLWSLEMIESLNESGSDIVPITSLDSSNGSLSDKVVVCKNARVTLKGAHNGALITRNWLHRLVSPAQQGVSFSAGPTLGSGSTWSKAKKYTPNVSEIILHEGEGVAFFQRTANDKDFSELSFTFTVERKARTAKTSYNLGI